MNYKDTIIKGECGFHYSGHCSELDRQAKVSFNAGIKDVTNWISEHVTNQSINPTIFPRTAWQMKLKEWGI